MFLLESQHLRIKLQCLGLVVHHDAGQLDSHKHLLAAELIAFWILEGPGPSRFFKIAKMRSLAIAPSGSNIPETMVPAACPAPRSSPSPASYIRMALPPLPSETSR